MSFIFDFHIGENDFLFYRIINQCIIEVYVTMSILVSFFIVQKPRAIFELKSDSAVVDYGVTDGYHQFSLYIDNQRVLWLAAEDNKVIM